MKPKGHMLWRSMEKGTLAMEVQAVSLQGREGQVGVGHPDQGPPRPAYCYPLFNTALNPLP